MTIATDADKKTIGLTPANKSIVDDLIARGWFKEGIDVAKFAMALAIKMGTASGTVEGAATVWNVGSFDPDGELKSLIPILFPDTTTPYRLVENLYNTGLEIISKELENDEYMELTDLMALGSN